MLRHLSIAAVVAAGLCAAAHAVPVSVTVTGPVEFNVIQGGLAGIPSGAPVVMSFNVDSNFFTNSPTFPTRGYPIDLGSFAMTVGGVNIPILNPQPGNATPYFVLRNNDPAVDGFFISTNGVDLPSPWSVNIPGLAPVHELSFSVGYSNGNQFPSLDILDALGTYDLSAIGSFLWGLGRFGTLGAEFNYETITLAIVPEPAALSLAGVAAAGMLARRRR